MPLFNGNILQLHALLIAAYAGVAKGIANNGKKPDVCTKYPQQYRKWYSMDEEGRSAEHNMLYAEWRERVERKLHAQHGGAPQEVGAAAAAARRSPSVAGRVFSSARHAESTRRTRRTTTATNRSVYRQHRRD